jgi:hypothetical protein
VRAGLVYAELQRHTLLRLEFAECNQLLQTMRVVRRRRRDNTQHITAPAPTSATIAPVEWRWQPITSASSLPPTHSSSSAQAALDLYDTTEDEAGDELSGGEEEEDGSAEAVKGSSASPSEPTVDAVGRSVHSTAAATSLLPPSLPGVIPDSSTPSAASSPAPARDAGAGAGIAPSRVEISDWMRRALRLDLAPLDEQVRSTSCAPANPFAYHSSIHALLARSCDSNRFHRLVLLRPLPHRQQRKSQAAAASNRCLALTLSLAYRCFRNIAFFFCYKMFLKSSHDRRLHAQQS